MKELSKVKFYLYLCTCWLMYSLRQNYYYSNLLFYFSTLQIIYKVRLKCSFPLFSSFLWILKLLWMLWLNQILFLWFIYKAIIYFSSWALMFEEFADNYFDPVFLKRLTLFALDLSLSGFIIFDIKLSKMTL